MVDTQLFCLRWKNYQSRITSAFEDLRDDEDFVDVTLACDSKTLKAHRVVLSACSPYFRELLKSTSCKHPVIVLQDVAYNDLRALVEFIYHGEVNINPESLGSFLKTAGVLGVSGLTQQVDRTDKPSRAAASASSADNLPTRDKKHNEGCRRRDSTPIGQRSPKRGQIRKNETLSSDSRDNRTSKKQRGRPPLLNASGAIPTKISTIKNHLPSKVNVQQDINELNIKSESLESTPNYLLDSQSFTSTSGSLKFSRPAPTVDLAALGSEYDLRTPDLPETLRIRKVATINRDCGSVITLDEVSHADYQEVTTNAEDDDDDEEVVVEEEDENEVEDDEGGGDDDKDDDDDDDLGNERTRDPLALMIENDGNDELLIIDHLDEVHNNMTFKTEPTSPKSNSVNDFESCPGHENHHDNPDPSEFNDPNLWQNDFLDRDSRGKRKRPHSPDKKLNISSAPPTRRSSRKLLEIARQPITKKQPSKTPLYCNTASKAHCHLCKKTFSRAWSLQRHLDDIHYYVSQPFPCDLCGRNYRSRNSLISHKSQYHPKKEKKYYDHLYGLTY